MDFSKLNAIARGLPTMRVTDLDVNRRYLMTRIKKVHTSYGDKIVIELDSEMQVFLPVRISETLIADVGMFQDMDKSVLNREIVLTYVNKIVQFDSK